MQIRRYLPGEEEAIWEVVLQATRVSIARDYHAELIDRWAPLDRDLTEWRERLAIQRPFVALLDALIVGMAELEPSGFIDYFYVQPDFQRRGVGSALMRRIEEEARTASLPELHAEVSVTAKSFFERHGFTVTEARRNIILGHPAPNFAMRKELGEQDG